MQKNYLLEKSDESFISGIELENLSFFNSSVHSFYYSVHQLCNYLIFLRKGWDFLEINDRANEKKVNTHIFVKNEIRNYFSKEEWIIFSGEYEKLRRNRIDADYNSFLFFDSKNVSISNIANNLRIQLRKKC